MSQRGKYAAGSGIGKPRSDERRARANKRQCTEGLGGTFLGAKNKERLENGLHLEDCSGRLSLRQPQKMERWTGKQLTVAILNDGR